MELAVIDYGMGNVASVQKGFSHKGIPAVVTADHQKIKAAAGVILPGVGAFGDGMANLQKRGLVPVIKEVIAAGTPFLGICIGMHLLMEEGFEHGSHQGLGILPGRVIRFDHSLKIPQIGWNSLDFQHSSPLFSQIASGSYVYFVHSYHVEQVAADTVTATTEYGYSFVSALQRDNVMATQFHPEKSQGIGLQILENFAALCF